MKASEVVVSDQVREQMAAFINGVRASHAVMNESASQERASRMHTAFEVMHRAREALIAAIIEANP
jgi:hypothetical protein